MDKTKKIFTLCVSMFVVAAMSITIAVAAKNNVSATPDEKTESSYTNTDTITCNGYGWLCYRFMRDANGDIVSRDIFEQNLDKAIADGIIPEPDRSYFVEGYDYCSANSAYCGNGNGTGCGNGRGMGQGGGCGMGRNRQ